MQRKTKVGRITGAMIVAVLAVAGCGGGKSTTTPAATTAPAGSAVPGGATPATGTTITIKNFKFVPDTVTVKPGTVVTVHNTDPTAHTLTASGSGGFDTGNIASGQTAMFTAPSTPGAFPYICTIHQFMHGTLTVG